MNKSRTTINLTLTGIYYNRYYWPQSSNGVWPRKQILARNRIKKKMRIYRDIVVVCFISVRD